MIFVDVDVEISSCKSELNVQLHTTVVYWSCILLGFFYTYCCEMSLFSDLEYLHNSISGSLS